MEYIVTYIHRLLYSVVLKKKVHCQCKNKNCLITKQIKFRHQTKTCRRKIETKKAATLSPNVDRVREQNRVLPYQNLNLEKSGGRVSFQ